MNYGISYMGSKSGIVRLIRYILERHYDKKYFIDVFCGGFAVSHYVLEKSNFKVYANDKNKYVVAFLEKLIYGGITDKVYDFVSRDTFIDVINNPDNYDDWYVGYVSTLWSFGNTQTNYMFGREVEPYKKSMHNAIVFNEWDETVSVFKDYLDEKIKQIDYKEQKEKRIIMLGILKRIVEDVEQDLLFKSTNQQQLTALERSLMLKNLQRLERSQQLERLERLQQLESLDWREFIDSISPEILKNAIIYCDPPYEDTAEYSVKNFSHDEFWQWFRTTPYCVYVSSYKAPDDIKPFNFEYKAQTLGGGSGKVVKENIYWNGKGEPIPTMEDLLFGLE